MRTYRLQIRIIQLSVILTMIVMVFGLVNVWRSSQEPPTVGDNTVQNGNGNASGDQNPSGNNDPEQEQDVLDNTKIVCIGDSYTIGWPGKQNESWPVKLAELLDIEVINAGKTQQNSENLLERFEQDVIAQQPGRVIIFAGVGDALRDKPFEEFQTNIKAMVQKAEANHIIPILALTIPYPGTEELYTAYREWEEDYAKEKKLTVLDFKTVLFDIEGKMLEKYSNDGKYPNKDGYAAMGEYAASVLK